METVQTVDHRLIFNESGVLIFKATDETEDSDLHPADAQEYQYQELLAIAEYVILHREQFVQIQQELESTWQAVAEEVIEYMEAERQGSSVHATICETQRVLAHLASVPQKQRSWAVSWYLPVMTHKTFPHTFFQQWVPFLRALHRRKEERFPYAFADL